MLNEFISKPLLKTITYHKSEILSDIVQRSNDVTKIWLVAGHTFVLLEKGKKLLAFDTRCISKPHTSGDKLFERRFETPLVDVLLTERTSHRVYFIQSNGRLECWIYNRSLYKWEESSQHNICKSQNGEVISACFQESLDFLYWCERCPSSDFPTYHIYRRYFDGNLQIGPEVHILKDCTQCSLYIFGTSILISTEISETAIPMVLLWSSVAGQISFYNGESWEKGDLWSARRSCDFKSLALKLMICPEKVSLLKKLKYLDYDKITQELIAIDEDCVSHILSESSSRKVQLKSVCIRELQLKSINKGILCYVSGKKLSFVCLKSGNHVNEVSLNEAHVFVSFLQSNWLAAPFVYLTNKNIYCIQRLCRSKPQLDEPQKDAKYLQSNALLLAHLDQQRNTDLSCDTELKLQELMKNWESENKSVMITQYSELVNPYMDEYWRIEKLWKNIFNKQSLMGSGELSIKSEVIRLLMHNSPLPLSVRQIHLILLAHSYPKEVMDILLEQMGLDGEFKTGKNSNSEKQIEIQKWQCLLLSENTSTPISGDISIPLFEHLCSLLLKEKPQNLVPFLRFTQKIHDQAVGISAFVRKRQAFQFFERALACLSDPEKSVEPHTAVKAVADIIEISECKHHRLKAVKLLAKYRLWKDALDIAEKSSNDHPLCSQLLHLILDLLSKEDDLCIFVERIIKIIPSQEIFIRIFTLLENCQNHQVKTPRIFSQRNDVSVQEVSSLIKSLHVNQK